MDRTENRVVKYLSLILAGTIMVSMAGRAVAQIDDLVEISEEEILEDMLLSEESILIEEDEFSGDEDAFISEELDEQPVDEAAYEEVLIKDALQNEADRPVDVFDEDPVEVTESASIGDAPAVPGRPAGDERSMPGPGGTGGVNIGAYEEVLKENLDLRREVDDLLTESETMSTEITSLKSLVKDLDRQVADSVGMIQKLKSEKESLVAAAELPDGKGSDQALQAAQMEIAQLKMAAQELTLERDSLTQQVAALNASKNEAAAAARGPQAGSALYVDMERENAELKQMVSEFEINRQSETETILKLEAANAELQARVDTMESREEALATKVQDTVGEQEKYKDTINKLLDHVPAMEEEIAELKNTVDVKDETILAREKELATLRQELERRELRIIRAERMSQLLEKTREEVKRASDKEKRDMHFNMAVVYTKEGKFSAAEGEYLHSLRVDPTDADSHYNLAILYDDHLGDRRRAAMHYRAYLKLAPNADDVDEVKSWLLALEMN